MATLVEFGRLGEGWVDLNCLNQSRRRFSTLLSFVLDLFALADGCSSISAIVRRARGRGPTQNCAMYYETHVIAIKVKLCNTQIRHLPRRFRLQNSLFVPLTMLITVGVIVKSIRTMCTFILFISEDCEWAGRGYEYENQPVLRTNLPLGGA
jgi:hypothetical protein